MSPFSIDADITIKRTRSDNYFAVVEVRIMKENVIEILSKKTMLSEQSEQVYMPGWFGRVVLRRTFEGEIKKCVAWLVKEATAEIQRMEKFEVFQKKAKEMIDGIFNRTS